MPTSIEAKLQLVNNPIERGAAESAGDYGEAELLLDRVAQQDAWDWRVEWYRGKSFAQHRHQEAQVAFDLVYFDLPGEIDRTSEHWE